MDDPKSRFVVVVVVVVAVVAADKDGLGVAGMEKDESDGVYDTQTTNDRERIATKKRLEWAWMDEYVSVTNIHQSICLSTALCVSHVG
jgi:hypothetical protein